MIRKLFMDIVLYKLCRSCILEGTQRSTFIFWMNYSASSPHVFAVREPNGERSVGYKYLITCHLSPGSGKLYDSLY